MAGVTNNWDRGRRYRSRSILEDINSVGHDVFQVRMRHSNRDDQQAVGYMSQGSKGSSEFQIRRNNQHRQT